VDLLYCLDTSVFIESWWRLYPPDTFPTFWEKLDEAIDEEILIAPVIVLTELEKKDDDIYKWAKERHSLFRPLDADLQQIQTEIVNRFPRLTIQVKNRSLADPWVIALAQFTQCPVVSMENPGSDSRPRIPDVCGQLGIGHINVVELIRALEWRF